MAPGGLHPQAWAAAAPFLLLQALLGITADATENALAVDRPRLPERLSRVEIRGLRVAGSRVSLSFSRTPAGGTGCSLLERQGNVRAILPA